MKQIQVGAEDFPARLGGQFGHEAPIVARPPDLFVSLRFEFLRNSPSIPTERLEFFPIAVLMNGDSPRLHLASGTSEDVENRPRLVVTQHSERPKHIKVPIRKPMKAVVLHMVADQPARIVFRLQPLRDVLEIDGVQLALRDVSEDGPRP